MILHGSLTVRCNAIDSPDCQIGRKTKLSSNILVYNALNTDLISELSRCILVYPIAGIRKGFQSILHLFGLGVCWT
ncbi:MAG: hypothetical protein A4E43_01140 [Methanosaeta sp. PtaB.Bin005]|nr:MAG: hypothetical protein A4E43_01140 [Methanosaeta sp. PtaB.Bin005]